VYHGDAQGDGLASSIASIDTATPRWTSPELDGQLYGAPIATSQAIFVATEENVVYALSPHTGRIVWARRLGTAVPSGDLPCGDISPSVGITGTPVIDTVRNEIFVVAEQLRNGSARHEFYGLNLTNGSVETSVDVDPPGANPTALLQRTGLSLDDGRVVFAMGGNYGDCANYRGRVISVGENSMAPEFFTVDARAGESQGAIWMGGAAPVVDSSGDVWVSSGNGSVHSAGAAYDDSDALLELSPSMHLVQYFAPTSWTQNNQDDLDMSMAPALVSNSLVLLAGKSGIVYLLNRQHLGGIGHQEATLNAACNGNIDGGIARSGDVVIMPCVNGPVAIRVTPSPAKISVLWRSSVSGGPAVIAAGLVWTIGLNGDLYGLNLHNGAVVHHVIVNLPANHFPTPGFGDGMMLIPTATKVIGFTTTSP
jgi:outer membrane protein assembly factor BamB